MKLYIYLTLISVASLLTSSCVSRTTTSEKGETEKKTVWIWQDDYKKEK
jgi:hypothetical protein